MNNSKSIPKNITNNNQYAESSSESNSWKFFLREYLFEGSNTYARIFNIILILLIFASIFIAILETVPSIHLKYGSLLWNFEILFTIIFTLEYILRVLSAKNPNKFIFSFQGIIDLISIMPFYVITIFGSSALINLVRILRLLRIGSRLIRLSKDFSNTMYFLVHIKEKLGNDEHIIYFFKRSRKRLWFGYLVVFFFVVISVYEIVFHYFSEMLGESIIIKIISYILFILSFILLIKYEFSTWYKRYAITNHRVIVSTGILHEDFKGTTYSYIADTYLYQSFFDRILNIGRIQVKTTGNEYQNIDLESVSKPLMVKKIIDDNIIKIHKLRHQQNSK